MTPRPFQAGDAVVVDYPGHPLHGAKGTVREHQVRLPVGGVDVGPVVGVDITRGRMTLGFWLSPDSLRLSVP